MTPRIRRVHPAVSEDIVEALDYYEAQDPALREHFVDAYVKALTTIQERPFLGREYAPGFRRLIVRPFPYLLAHAAHDEGVFVAALLHARRDPVVNEGILRSRS